MLWIVEGGLLFVLVVVDDLGYFLFQFFVNVKIIFQYYLLQIGDVVFQVIYLGVGLLQVIGGMDIEYQQMIDVVDQCCFVEIVGKQVGVMWFYFVVVVDVQILVFVGGNYFDIFFLGFSVFVGVVGDCYFDFVWGVQFFIVMFELYCEFGGVLYVVVISG